MVPPEDKAVCALYARELRGGKRTFAAGGGNFVLVCYLDAARGIDPDVEKEITVRNFALAEVNVFDDVEAVRD